MSGHRDELSALALRVQLAAFGGPELPASAAHLLEAGLGGICLFASNTAAGADRVHRLVRQVRSAGEQPVVAIDEEGGDVTRLHAAGGSPSPGHAVLGRVDDTDLTQQAARAIGLELAASGIDLNLAPVADVNSNPDNPIIGVRSFGADPVLVARHVAAFVRGLQSTGVAACAKHFPGHGDTAQDSHTDLPRIDAPPELLRRRELVPFAAAVDAGVAAVMTSHILVPAYGGDLPATLSPDVLARLRGELGFCGVVVTDALDMAGASGGGRGIGRAAVLALAAGADLLCLGADKDARLVESVRDAVVRGVQSGDLSEDRLRDAAARVDGLRGARAADPADPVALAPSTAARRALEVDGTLPALVDATVVRVQTTPSIAVGAVPWGIDADVELDPACPTAPETLAEVARKGPVLVQVRDLHRHPQARLLVDHLAGTRCEIVVIEWGWPSTWELAVPRIRTYGASVASRLAVEELLADATGWKP